jgi:dihydrolipoamide dehydrogenase
VASYDLIIIGAGPGGYVAAIRAAQLGLKTALVESRATLGGTCLNVGCIPSKALLESSELYARVAHHLGDHGIAATGVSLDLPAMLARKERIVGELTGGVAMLMKKNKVAVITGRGILQGPGRVRVETDGGTQELEAKHVLLAMGSVPIELPFLPFDGERVVSSTEALCFPEVPGHLLVVGAGAIGLELGSVWARLGGKVTVVEMLPGIVPAADGQMARTLERALADQGIVFRLSTRVTGAVAKDGKLIATLVADKGEEQLECDRILVAVGRKPCTQGSGLAEAGVALAAGGRVAVDEHFRTNLEGVYAIGDLIAGPMLAHKAEDEGLAVAELLAGQKGHVNYDAIPNVVYTEPELAMVGQTQEQLKEAGIPVNAGRFQFRANGRAKSLGQEVGMVKILAHKETDRILGVHIVGPRASELIAEAVMAMELGASAEDLARTCHAHPTLSEVVREAALAVDGRALHG